MTYRLFPPEDYLTGRVRLPESKSMMARRLVMGALCGEAIEVSTDAPDDVLRLSAALQQGTGRIDLGGSATAMRLLAAYFASRPGVEVELTGSDQLLSRPMHTVVDALRSMGAEIECLGSEGYAPLRIRGRQLRGGTVEVDATVTSQAVSALSLIAPYIEGGLTVRLVGEGVSVAYARLTLGMMRAAGADAEIERDTITIREGGYSDVANRVAIEPDMSAAAFWYELTAMSGGSILTDRLNPNSMQPDAVARTVFDRLCVQTLTESEDEPECSELMAHPDADSRLTLDCTECPDLVPAIAVTCTLLRTPFRLTGLRHLRHKESSRAEVLRHELRRIGALLEIEADGDVLQWEGASVPIAEVPAFSAHDDHRIAMALAPIALFLPGVTIEGAESNVKSYPGYWDNLRELGFTVEEVLEP